MNEDQSIQRENKHSGCVPGTDKAAHLNQKHGKHQGNSAEIEIPSKTHAADMTMAPSSIPSLHRPMEKQHGN